MKLSLPMRRLTPKKPAPAVTSTLGALPALHELPTLQAWGNPPRVGGLSKGWGVPYLMVFMLTGTLVLKAQKRSIVHTSQQWVQVYAQVEINGKLSILADAGMRQTHNGKWPSQRLIRTGIGYRLPYNWQGATGFARFSFQQDGRTNRQEWRIWQELNRSHPLGSITLQHRLRAEARFFEQTPSGSEPGGHSFNMRFRYRLQASIPVARLGRKKEESPALMLTVADELFVNTGKEIIHNTLDNNRLIVGPALRINPRLMVAMLYNHQYGHRSRRNTAESAEICWMTLTWKGRLKASDKAGRFQ